MRRGLVWLLLALLWLPLPARAGGSFDTGYGIWSPSGLWHRVAYPACVSPSSGVACVYYGIDSGCSYANGQIQDAGLSTLAPVTLTASTAFISFWLLYQVQSYDPACQDQLVLEYEENSTWYAAANLSTQTDPTGGSPVEGWCSGSGLGDTPLWQFQTINLQNFAGTSYYWRFRYVSSATQMGNALCNPPDLMQNFLGYALDDITFGSAAVPLALSKSVAPAFGGAGTTFTFTMSVTNTASSAATLLVSDPLPSPASDYSSASAPGGSISNGVAQWTLPNVAPGQGETVDLVVQAAPGVPLPTNWIDQAVASSSLTTTTVQSSQVLAKLRASGVALSKSVSPTSLTNGGTATYSLIVENDTSLTQSALTLTDNVPAAFSPAQAYPPLSGSTYWTLGSVAPGQVLSFMLQGPVYGQNGQVVVNSAQVSGSTTSAQVSASLTVQQVIQPSISIQAVFPNPAPAHGAGQPQEAFVAYTLSTAMPVTLDIYDVAGEKVRSLSAPGLQGAQQVGWDLKNSYGMDVASGLYVLRLWSSLSVAPAPQATGYLAVRR